MFTQFYESKRLFYVINNQLICRMNVKTFSGAHKETANQETSSQLVRELNFPINNNKGEFKYKNQVSFEKVQDNHQKCGQIKIVNQLCSEKGNMLEKITSIKFGDQIITIKDQYNLEAPATQTAQISNKKRLRIFKKSLAQKQDAECERRITNNLPKNFIKAFINYLSDIEDPKTRSYLQSRIQALKRKQKFNNNLIQKIVNDQQIYNYFQDFLENNADSWIQNSKIKNKKMHLEAKKVFLRLKPTPNAVKGKANQETTTILKARSSNSAEQIENNLTFGLLNMSSGQNEKDSILANQSQGQGAESIFEEGLKKYNFDI